MQLHLPHIEAHWQPWARGIAIVLAMLAAPVVIAIVWLTILRAIV